MEEIKPNSVKIVGIIIIGISVFAIFGNGLGSLALISGGALERNQFLPAPRLESDLIGSRYYVFFNYIFKYSLLMLLFGLLFLIGGIFLTKYKNWARVSLIILTSIFILCQTLILITIMSNIFDNTIYFLSNIGIIIAILFFIAISFTLIIYLNKKQIKRHYV